VSYESIFSYRQVFLLSRHVTFVHRDCLRHALSRPRQNARAATFAKENRLYLTFIIRPARYWLAGDFPGLGLGQKKCAIYNAAKTAATNVGSRGIRGRRWKRIRYSELAPVPAGSGRVNGGEVISHSGYRAREWERGTFIIRSDSVSP